MSIYKLILLVILVIGISLNCSKKKEEAAKLEQEVLLQDSLESLAQDTLGEQAAGIDSTEDMGEVSALPEEELLEMPRQPQGEGYTVQVAGCEDRSYAAYLIDKYTERGYEPYISTITVEGETYYRVRIGLYESINEAKALKEELDDKYSINTWIDVTE